MVGPRGGRGLVAYGNRRVLSLLIVMTLQEEMQYTHAHTQINHREESESGETELKGGNQQ